jgi:acetyl-CoA carboxylase/biotin carboxylase 1
MEAKGCAKPVVWKNARRHFYWALRARLARSSALKQLLAASPESTVEYRSRVLLSLIPTNIDASNNHQLAEAIESLDLTPTITSLRNADISRKMFELLHTNRKAALEGLFRAAADVLSEDEKGSLQIVLQGNGERSPG